MVAMLANRTGDLQEIVLSRPVMDDESPPKRKRGDTIPDNIMLLFGGAAALADVQKRKGAAPPDAKTKAVQKEKLISHAHLLM